MVDIADTLGLAESLARPVVGDVTERLAQRAASAFAKLPDDRGAEQGDADQVFQAGLLSRLDVSSGVNSQPGSSIRANILLPTAYAKEPELFARVGGVWTPFMQLGTFLGIENEAARLITDIVFDPTNLVVPGSGAILNLAGRTGRLLSAANKASKGGRAGLTIGRALDSVESVVKVAGRLMDDADYLRRFREAAQSGVGARKFKRLIDEGLAADRLPARARELLEVVRSSRDATTNLFKAVEDLGGARAVAADEFLQPGVLGRLLAGQVNPPLRVEKPFAMTRQLIGIGYRDPIAWSPVAPKIAFGKAADVVLDRMNPLRGSSLTGRAAQGTPEAADIGRAFREREGALGTPGRTTSADALFELDLATAPLTAPSARFATDSGFGLDDDAVLRVYSQLHPRKAADLSLGEAQARTAFKRTGEFAEFRDTVQRTFLDSQGDAALGQIQALNERMLAAEARARALTPDDADELLQGRTAFLQATADVMHPQHLVSDSGGLGNAVLSRIDWGNFRAGNFVGLANDVVSQAYPNPQGREAIREVLGRLSDAPGVWKMVEEPGGATRAVLKSDAEIASSSAASFARGRSAGRAGASKAGKKAFPKSLAEASPLLDSTLRRNPGLREQLETAGLAPEVTAVATGMRDSLRSIGDNLLSEHVLPEVIADYFMRVAKPTPKLAKQSGRVIDRDFVFEQIGNPEGIFGNSLRDATDASGRLTMSRARQVTEAQLLRMEREGLVEVERDSLSLFGEYLAAANRALTANAVFQEVPKALGKATKSFVDNLEAAGFKGASSAAGHPVVYLDEAGLVGDFVGQPPAGIRNLYRKIDGPQRFGMPSESEKAERAVLEGLRGNNSKASRALREAAVEDVSLDIAGAKEIGDVPITLKDPTLGPAVAEPDWAITGVPRSVRRRVELERAINKQVKARESELQAALRLRVGRIDEAAEGASRRGTIWVLKGVDGPMREALRLFERNGFSNHRGWQRLDNLNFAVKGTVLSFDVFHGIVLAHTSMLSDPGKIARTIATGKDAVRRALVNSGVGAGFGGAVSAVMGGDTEDVAVGSVVGALWANALAAAVVNSKSARFIAPVSGANAQAMKYAGLTWTGRPNDRAIGIIGNRLRALRTRLASEAGDRALLHPIDKVRHVSEGFDHLLWEQIHNGSKMSYFQTKFAEAHEALAKSGKLGRRVENGVDQELLAASREIMATADTFFGGQHMSRVFADPNMQFFARRFLLSPDWTTGRLLGAASIMMNMDLPRSVLLGGAAGSLFELAEKGFDLDEMTAQGALFGAAGGVALSRWASRLNARMFTRGDTMARESRRLMSAALFGGFLFANVLNIAYTGKPMWENEEGKKLQIKLPGDTKFLKLGKPWLEAFEFLGVEERRPLPLFSRTAEKMSPVPRFALQVLTNHTAFGPIVRADHSAIEKLEGFAEFTVGQVTPIFAAGPSRAAQRISFGRDVNPGEEIGAALARVGGLNVTSARSTASVDRSFNTLLERGARPSLSRPQPIIRSR